MTHPPRLPKELLDAELLNSSKVVDTSKLPKIIELTLFIDHYPEKEPKTELLTSSINLLSQEVPPGGLIPRINEII